MEHGKLIDKKSNENVITNSSLNEEKNDSSKTNQNKDTTANVKNVSDSIAKEKEDTEKVDAVSNEHQKLSKAVAKKKIRFIFKDPGQQDLDQENWITVRNIGNKKYDTIILKILIWRNIFRWCNI